MEENRTQRWRTESPPQFDQTALLHHRLGVFWRPMAPQQLRKIL
jgi:hypothetical protein